MDNKEYLEKIKTDDEFLSMSDLREKDIEYRKVKATEIIAEELIKVNETKDFILTTLENIETTMKAR
jgi:hypothetical protein